jgi:hypothetical protein
LLIPFILAGLFLVAALAFGGWAFTGRQDYKTNVDQKIAAAVTLAKQQESTLKDKQFTEAEKQPLKTYTGPQAYGSVSVKYPKTWSGYVDGTGGNAQLDGYFNPGVVPAITGDNSVFALRIQVVAQSYENVLTGFRGQQQAGQLAISPYALPKVPNVVGVRVIGQINQGKSVDMIVLPLRDKTIQVSTEGSEFSTDFNTTILPNFSFSP